MEHRTDASDTARAASPGRASSHGLRELIGGAIARLREARITAPTAHTFAGRIEPIIGGHFEIPPGGGRLDGRVLVRVSGTLWRRERAWFDVLEVGVRIRPGHGPLLNEVAEDGDQDLLFASSRSVLTLPLAPLVTDASTFLQTYWATSAFLAPLVGRIELRLRPIGRAVIGGTRIGRLREAVRRGQAGWWLEARRPRALRWHPVALISLEREVILDQTRLAFDSLRAGAELEPVGFVHALRRAATTATRRARHLLGT